MANSKRTAVGLLVALGVVLVVFYFATAVPSSNPNKGEGQASVSIDKNGLRGSNAPPPTWNDDVSGEGTTTDTETWKPTVFDGIYREVDDLITSSTDTPTIVVYDTDGFDWEDLPAFAKNAATTLGYDQRSWDNDSLNEQRSWERLSMAEQEAAVALGYHHEYWNEFYGNDVRPNPVANANANDDMDDMDDATATPTEIAWDGLNWADLPDRVKDAAKQLGYTEDSWDNETPFPGIERHWDELSPSEHTAAMSLGWDRSYWENVVYELGTETPTTIMPTTESSTYPYTYAAFEWDELPDEVRAAAELLGWNEGMWCDEDPLPLRTSTPWKGLTDEQKGAATTVGFTELAWDDTR